MQGDSYAKDRYLAEEPAFRAVEPSYFVKCHFAEEITAGRTS